MSGPAWYLCQASFPPKIKDLFHQPARREVKCLAGLTLRAGGRTWMPEYRVLHAAVPRTEHSGLLWPECAVLRCCALLFPSDMGDLPPHDKRELSSFNPMKIKGESQLRANLVIGSRMEQKNIDLVFPIVTAYSKKSPPPPPKKSFLSSFQTL